MLYYRVTAEGDNQHLWKYNYNNKCLLWTDEFLVQDELYTPTEYKKLMTKYYKVNPNYFKPVNISKRNIYWMFGARVAD